MKKVSTIIRIPLIILLFILSSCQKEKMRNHPKDNSKKARELQAIYFKKIKEKQRKIKEEKIAQARSRQQKQEEKRRQEELALEQARAEKIEQHRLLELKRVTLESKEAQALLLRTKTKMDVIWVIDNTGSMREDREQLKDSFETFISRFAKLGFDFRNVVLTTDYDERGKTYGDAKSLSREAYEENSNLFIENFMDAIGSIESKNSEYLERGFANVRHFMGIKEGKRFLSRKDAYTIIIFVSDEDDQSQSLLEKKRQHLLSVKRYIHRFKVVTKKNANQGLLKVYSVVNLFEANLANESFNHEKVGARYIEASKLTGGSAIDIHDNFQGLLDSILHLPTLPLVKQVGVEGRLLDLTIRSTDISSDPVRIRTIIPAYSLN